MMNRGSFFERIAWRSILLAALILVAACFKTEEPAEPPAGEGSPASLNDQRTQAHASIEGAAPGLEEDDDEAEEDGEPVGDEDAADQEAMAQAARKLMSRGQSEAGTEDASEPEN